MDNIFTIHYDAYKALCGAREDSDVLLLGVLTDIQPSDDEGYYQRGEVMIPIEDLWERRMLKVPANLAGTIVRVLY